MAYKNCSAVIAYKILHLWSIALRPLKLLGYLNPGHAQKREIKADLRRRDNNYQISTYTSVQVDVFGTAWIKRA